MCKRDNVLETFVPWVTALKIIAQACGCKANFQNANNNMNLKQWFRTSSSYQSQQRNCFFLTKTYIKGEKQHLCVCLSCLLRLESHDGVKGRQSSVCLEQRSTVCFIISELLHGQSSRKLHCTYLSCVYSEPRTRDQVFFGLMPQITKA